MTVPFFNLSEEDRIARTHRAIQARETLSERWAALATSESEPWSARAALAAGLLGEAQAVVDLGCGLMTLERHLPPPTRYIPVDVVRRDERTTVCDLNADLPPALPADAVACLGVLEYIHDPRRVLLSLGRHYARAVVSYCHTDAPQPLVPRRAFAWVNDFDRSRIEALFHETGWVIETARPVDQIQTLWLLRSRSHRRRQPLARLWRRLGALFERPAPAQPNIPA